MGAMPGVTRQVSAFRIASTPPLYLVDTPGVMVPRVDRVTAGLCLALTRAVPDAVVPPDILVRFMLRVVRSRRLFGAQKSRRAPPPPPPSPSASRSTPGAGLSVCLFLSLFLSSLRRFMFFSDGGWMREEALRHPILSRVYGTPLEPWPKQWDQRALLTHPPPTPLCLHGLEHAFPPAALVLRRRGEKAPATAAATPAFQGDRGLAVVLGCERSEADDRRVEVRRRPPG